MLDGTVIRKGDPCFIDDPKAENELTELVKKDQGVPKETKKKHTNK